MDKTLKKRNYNELPLCEKCSCPFCDEFQGTKIPLHTLLTQGEIKSRILLNVGNWKVVPTIGPLVPGHIMLLPNEHNYSIINSLPDNAQDFIILLEKCASKLKAIYQKDILIFEHGVTERNSRKCSGCIEHAHIHLLPGPISFISTMLSKFNDWNYQNTLLDFVPSISEYPYLMIGVLHPKPSFWVRKCVNNLPSQFLRKIMAQELNEEIMWDWRKYPRTDFFNKTIKDWKEYAETS